VTKQKQNSSGWRSQTVGGNREPATSGPDRATRFEQLIDEGLFWRQFLTEELRTFAVCGRKRSADG